MSKKSEALQVVVRVDEKAFSVTKDKKTGKETFSLAPYFVKDVKADANSVGEHLVSVRQYMSKPERQARALTMVAAYDKYKGMTKASLPYFCKHVLGIDCPESYGAVGSDVRSQINSNAMFQGIERMVKAGREAVRILNDVKELQEAGVDLSDPEAVKQHRADSREENAKKVQNAINKTLMEFDQHGVTEQTIENFVVRILHKAEKGTQNISKAGEKVATIALKAVFAARQQRKAGSSVTDSAKAKATKK